jgi:hypothetical protein
MTEFQVNTARFQHYPDLDGGDAEETAFLLPMADEALAYIRGFRWAPPIRDLYLAFGIGKIIALFLVRFERPIKGDLDEELWVVVGDMPSAYFVTEAAPDPAEALTAYCELMEDWADRIFEGRDLEGSYPIPVAPTIEHAGMLKSRMETIRKEFVPMAEAGEVVPY